MKRINLLLSVCACLLFSCTQKPSDGVNDTTLLENQKTNACVEYLGHASRGYTFSELLTIEGRKERCEVILNSPSYPSGKIPASDYATNLEFYDPGHYNQRGLIAYDSDLNLFFGVSVLVRERAWRPRIPSSFLEPNFIERRDLVNTIINSYKNKSDTLVYSAYPIAYTNTNLTFDENSIIYYLREKFKGRPFNLDSIRLIYGDFMKVINYYGEGADYQEISVSDFLDFVYDCRCEKKQICCESERLIFNMFFEESSRGYQLPPVIYKRDGEDKYIIFNLHEATGGIIRSASQFEVLTLFEDGKAFD